MVFKSPKELGLIDRLGPVLSSMNFELRDLEIRQGNPALVRVTIDIPDRSRGIHLDDCYEVHKVLDPIFDVLDPLENTYTLEVSSPGEKAPLRLKEHFQEALGSNVEFKTREALPLESNPTAAPRRNWKGRLAEVGEDFLVLEDSLGRHRVSAKNIEGARWLRDWSVKKTEEPYRPRAKQG